MFFCVNPGDFIRNDCYVQRYLCNIHFDMNFRKRRQVYSFSHRCKLFSFTNDHITNVTREFMPYRTVCNFIKGHCLTTRLVIDVTLLQSLKMESCL